MPLKLTLRFGSTAVLELDGDATIDENLVKLAAEIVKALPPHEQQDAQTQVDALTDRLAANTTGLADAVGSRTPHDAA
jgi:hypothetical protein